MKKYIPYLTRDFILKRMNVNIITLIKSIVNNPVMPSNEKKENIVVNEKTRVI